ncbi:MAG TPA: hypothetical protein VK912_14615 [Longimicrobiales bacterium]|nr:hypothetical protein [Longimicrobiales bacterium]
MYMRSIPVLAVALLGCQNVNEPAAPGPEAAEVELSAGMEAALRTVEFPGDDPGPPLYSRVTPLSNQIFADGGWVAIPIYRDPACIPPDADLFAHFHPPGPAGPGAFGCDLLIEGSYIIEADAPLGTFPVRSVAKGAAQVRFVREDDLTAAVADGHLTMAELDALSPLRGTATSFHEMLAPRLHEHHVVITSRGRLEDGRTFVFNVNHRGDTTQSIMIRIR